MAITTTYLLKNTSLLVLCSVLFLEEVQAQSVCDSLESSIRTGDKALLKTLEVCVSEDQLERKRLVRLLDTAVGMRRQDVALRLLELGVQPTDYYQLLSYAATFELPDLVRLILNSYPDILQENAASDASIPLRMAAITGSYNSAKVLIEHGADVHSGEPLLAAVAENQLHIAHLLIQHGALEGLSDPLAGEILGSAVRYTNVTFLQFLLDVGFSPNLHNKKQEHVLLYAPHHEVELSGPLHWQFLISRGADARGVACELSESTFQHIVEHGPMWYSDELSAYREICE